MIFETHGHYDDSCFDEDRDALFADFAANDIAFVMNIGCDEKTSRASVALTEKYDIAYATVGSHPSELTGDMDQLMALYAELAKNPKVKAIGEIGLDYHWKDYTKETQMTWFLRQLELAEELMLPVVIHSREASQDTFDVMKEWADRIVGGVIHCYSGSPEMALEYVKLGFYIGVGGVVTFANGKKMKEVVATIPLENIVLETDSPYLAPVPNRGKRNSALNIPYVAEEIAKIKGVPIKQVYDVTFANAMKLYRMEQ